MISTMDLEAIVLMGDGFDPHDDEIPGGFADWLRERLRERDWNNTDLARRTGWPEEDRRINPGAMSKYIRGLRLPNPARVELIARALGVSLDEAMAAAGYIDPPSDPERRHLAAMLDALPSRDIESLTMQIEGIFRARQERARQERGRERSET